MTFMYFFEFFKFKRRKYYVVEWSGGSKDITKYTTIIKAFNPLQARMKVEKQHALPIFISSIKEGKELVL